MTDTQDDGPQYRRHYQPDPDAVTVRDLDDEEDGLFEVRMPIASTGEVRNEGDEPLTRDELDGMAAQINEGDAGVFLAHGRSFEITDARYGQTERLGSWQDADVSTDERAEDDTALLEASAVMADPDGLPDETGRFREALAILKSQAELGIPMSSSIGWREDESAPGGNDLMEASIVGIPADPVTNTEQAQAQVLARAAIGAGADPETFVDEVRSAVMGATTDDRDPDDSMTDDDTSADDADDTTDEEQDADERDDTPEWVSELLEGQNQIAERLGDVAEALREDDEDDEDEDDEEENEGDDEDDEEDEDENAAEEPDDEQDADDDTEEQAADEIAEQRDALETLREGGYDVDDIEIPGEEQDGTTDSDRDADTPGDADGDEEGIKSLLKG